MTREEAKELLPIIQAFTDGKTLEFLNDHNMWKELEDPLFCKEPKYYRIKIEPKYRPFNSKEECWEEMQKHKPFGWIKSPNGKLFCIDTITDVGITNIHRTCQFSDYLEINYTFADGTPFGIKEE